jgi:hypothetical protein
MNTQPIKKMPYLEPKLEQQNIWTQIIGVSLPIGTTDLNNPFEPDLMEGVR